MSGTGKGIPTDAIASKKVKKNWLQQSEEANQSGPLTDRLEDGPSTLPTYNKDWE